MAAPNGSFGATMRGPYFVQAPIQISATYQINGGTAIAAGASITDSKTFTGVATTDEVVIGWDSSVQVLLNTVPGLVLSNIQVTAADTVALTWTNTSTQSITPPATSQKYYAGRVMPFYGV